MNGTLYPTLPGANTLRLTFHPASDVAAPAGPVRVVAAPAGPVRVVVTMPGMGMPPVTAALTARGRAYAGVIRLPMFGDYRAALSIRASARRYTGAIPLAIPLDVPAVQHH